MLLQQEQRVVIAQRIDPKLIMANAILQLNSMELLQSIENELLENPALDTLETLDETSCSGNCIDPASCPCCAARQNAERLRNDDSDGPDWNDYEGEEEVVFGANAMEGDEDFDLINSIEAELTLQDHLRTLLRAVVPAEEYWIGEYLIYCLDERGWLDGGTDTIARDLGIDETEVLRLLSVIQTFDPPGIGARNLQECLLLQFRFLHDNSPDSPETARMALAEQLVANHFEHVGARRYAKLSRLVGISPEEVRLALEFVRTRLNPFPANQFRAPWQFHPINMRAAIRPDVLIRRISLGYEVEVVGLEALGLCVNPNYRQAVNAIKEGKSGFTPDDKKHFIEHVDRAELFLRNLKQRRDTLRQITKTIIECQTGFLETGSRQFLRPLTRTSIARQLDIHESTVSRATANKYVQLPNQEVVNFQIFFNNSLSIKESIELLIQDEDPNNPLSDIQLVELLKERGIHVARRTIVKYREARKILSSTHRRR